MQDKINPAGQPSTEQYEAEQREKRKQAGVRGGQGCCVDCGAHITSWQGVDHFTASQNFEFVDESGKHWGNSVGVGYLCPDCKTDYSDDGQRKARVLERLRERMRAVS